jgi:hypothetical protein
VLSCDGAVVAGGEGTLGVVVVEADGAPFEAFGALPGCSWLLSCSYALTSSLKISGGIVPPSTGPRPYSVYIGFSEFAWPTQTATVMSWFAPTNQASPLFSVVPVLPHSVGSPV